MNALLIILALFLAFGLGHVLVFIDGVIAGDPLGHGSLGSLGQVGFFLVCTSGFLITATIVVGGAILVIGAVA